MRYHRFRWVLSPGDDHDHLEWGDSWWYYEFGPDGCVSRQIMLYDCGIRVRYGIDHVADAYGELLSDVRLEEVNLSMGQDIEAAEFQSVWQTGPWTNGPAE